MESNIESKGTDWTQKGTGWVQSLFDPSDYTLKTLKSEETQKPGDGKTEKIGKIETIGETDQIDKLTEIIDKLLQVSALKDHNDVEELRRNLNKSVISIQQARVHKLLKREDRDMQILRVKDLLKSFFIYFPTFRNQSQRYEPDFTSLEFDDETQKALQDFNEYLAGNELLQNWFGETHSENLEIDVDIMTALYKIVKASESVNQLHSLAKDWLIYIEKCKDEEKLSKFREEDRWKEIIVKIRLLEVLGSVVEKMRERFLSNQGTENTGCLKNIQEELGKKFGFLEKPDEFEATHNVLLKIANLPCYLSFEKLFADVQAHKDQLHDAINNLIKVRNHEEVQKALNSEESVQSKKSEMALSEEQLVEQIKKIADAVEGMVWEILGTTPLPLFPALFEKEIVPISPPIPAHVFDVFLNQLEKRDKSEQWRKDYSILHSFVNLRDRIKLNQRDRSSKDEIIILTQRHRISEVIVSKISPLGGRNLKQSVDREIDRLEKLMKQPKDSIENKENDGTPLLEQLEKLVNEIIKIWQGKEAESENSGNAVTGKRELLEIIFDDQDDRTDQMPKYHQEIVYLPLKGAQALKIEGDQKSKTEGDQKSKPEGTPTPYYLSLPELVDLSYWCSDVVDQGRINSCTAQSGIALIEYFDKRINKSQYTPLSARFLYKAARNFMKRQGDSGVGVRDVMKTMIQFGVCPASHWTYEEEKFDEEPTSFCYSFAQNYQTIKYFRLDLPSDSPRMSRYALLTQIKVLLTSGFPCMFGFMMHSSIYAEENVRKGHIPYPSKELDRLEGGHSLVAVGYDNNKVIENAEGEETVGALLVRNSWGKRYGIGGYGYLPYKYVLEGLTADWWSLMKAEWIKPDEFGINWDDTGGRGGGTVNPCGEEHCWCGKHLNTKQPLSQ